MGEKKASEGSEHMGCNKSVKMAVDCLTLGAADAYLRR